MKEYKFDLDTVKTVSSKHSEFITNLKIKRIMRLRPCLSCGFDCYIEKYYDGSNLKARLRVKDDDAIIKVVSLATEPVSLSEDKDVIDVVNGNNLRGFITDLMEYDSMLDKNGKNYIYMKGNVLDNYTIGGNPQRYIELAFNSNLMCIVK